MVAQIEPPPLVPSLCTLRPCEVKAKLYYSVWEGMEAESPVTPPPSPTSAREGQQSAQL